MIHTTRFRRTIASAVRPSGHRTAKLLTGGAPRLVTGAATLAFATFGIAAGAHAAPPATPALVWSGTANLGTLNFGSSSSQKFTLTNTRSDGSSGAITVSLSGSRAFSITSDGCTGTALGPLKSCMVTVQYAPAAPGQRDAATLGASSKQLGGAGIGLTGASTVPTTTTVTDNATTVPGGPPPVTWPGAIIFTATVSSATGSPSGTIHWSLAQDGPDYALDGSGIVDPTTGLPTCGGAVPVVNGVATCSVTPTQYWDDGDGLYLPFQWSIRATATFTPASGSALLGSSGPDDTSKITVGNLVPTPFSPFIPVAVAPGDTLHLQVTASDALNRQLGFWWYGLPTGYTLTNTPMWDAPVGDYAGVSTWTLTSVCPAGVAPNSGSFECQYPTDTQLTVMNEYQGT